VFSFLQQGISVYRKPALEGGNCLFLLVENAEVYAPDILGRQDILVAGEKIVWIGRQLTAKNTLPGLKTIDGSRYLAVPGFVDNHIHIAGGGGEGSFRTRTPEVSLTDLTSAGITSVIGVIGTDCVTRHTSSLVAKAKSLEEEGISAWALLGSYQLPIRTFTGHIQDDIVLIDKLIGVGEVAISDHRSSQPVRDELARIAAAARVGGLLSGKGGLVNVHLGDGLSNLDMLFDIAATSEISLAQFLPTHLNRNPQLFEEAIRFGLAGGYVDVTTSTTPVFLEEGEVKCSKAMKRLLDAGVPVERISFSSDGQGSLPDFDENGNFKGLSIGRAKSIWPEVRDAVSLENIPLETALKAITSSPSDHHKLPGRKGHIEVGSDADMVLLDENLDIDTVIARGKVMVSNGEILVFGAFERN
jgi:beta-aspartyl-dipeptidase (metallo-type)